VIHEHTDVISKVAQAIEAIEIKVEKEEYARKEARNIEERVVKAV
jgi:fructose-1,6-bisphosphatase